MMADFWKIQLFGQVIVVFQIQRITKSIRLFVGKCQEYDTRAMFPVIRLQKHFSIAIPSLHVAIHCPVPLYNDMLS